jgi:hypothetical protein
MANRKLGEVHQCGCDVCANRPRSREAREHRKINRMVSTLDEKNARRVIGMMAEQLGRGGVTKLHVITGLSRNTIMRGQRELAEPKDAVPPDRVRTPGGGRPPLEKKRQS